MRSTFVFCLIHKLYILKDVYLINLVRLNWEKVVQIQYRSCKFFSGGSQEEINVVWDHTFMTSARNRGGWS